MPVKYHDNVPTLPRGIISFSPRSCHLFPTCSPETASWLTGRYCLSPEVLPKAPHGGEPAPIDSIISKRQKPPLWEPGGSFCFNEAKVASTFVCAWLQSDSDLSRAESKFRTLPRNHVSLPTSVSKSPMKVSHPPSSDGCCHPTKYPYSDSLRGTCAASQSQNPIVFTALKALSSPLLLRFCHGQVLWERNTGRYSSFS